MLAKAFLAVAGIASATALLIPPNVVVDTSPAIDALSQLEREHHDYKMALVPCPGCALPMAMADSNGAIRTVEGVDNHLSVYINVDGKRLLANGFELYPHLDAFGGTLRAFQVPNDRSYDTTFDGEYVDVPLGYSVFEHSVGHDASNGMEVVSIVLGIFEVNHVMVKDIPSVSIRLIRKPDGALMIGRLEITGDRAVPVLEPVSDPDQLTDGQADHSDDHVSHHDSSLPHQDRPGHHGHPKTQLDDQMASIKKQLSKCSNFLCRWKVILGTHLQSGCDGSGRTAAMGHHGHHSRPMQAADDDESNSRHHHHKSRPNNIDIIDMEDGRQFRIRHRHSWGKLFKKFSSHILFPIMVGIAAGVMVSLLGMAVGTMIVTVWRMFFARRVHAHRQHRHHAGTARRHRHRYEEGPADEKAALMVAELLDGVPPTYEEQPTQTKESKEAAEATRVVEVTEVTVATEATEATEVTQPKTDA